MPKNDEVLIKIDSVGICGSDLSFFTKGGVGFRKISKPFIIGHEASGILVQLRVVFTNAQ